MSAIKDTDKLEDDLELDSLDNIELIMDLETEFNIDIPDEDADKLTTVLEVYEYIEKRVG